MADKEIKFKVTTEADTSSLEDIERALAGLEDKTITVRPEIQSMELEEVENRIEELENKRAEIYMGVDDTPLEEVEAELEELEARQLELTVDADSSGVDNVTSSVEDLEGEIESVNNTSIGPQADTSGVEEVKESTSGLEDALSAVGTGATLAGMENMVATAGNIQDSWNRLGLTFGDVTGQMKADISEASEATGRSGGLVRGYFNDMGIAGVRNTELLQQSFEALSGRAYQTGNSIESMEQKMKMMVMSGNAGARQLTALGISTQDLGRAMGVSADEATKMFKNLSQEERLRVLTQAMGDGKKANEDYKHSWQGLKDQVDKATGALMGAVGSAILPVLVPVMEIAAKAITAFAEGFKALPEPVRAVVGVFGALVMGFLAFQTVMSALKALQIIQIFSGLIGPIKSVAAAMLELDAAVLMNPFTILIGTLVILIGYMVYLYQTNEKCRESVNKLGEDLQRVASGDYSALRDVGNDLMAASDSFAQASGFAALIGEENYNRWVELRNGMLQAFGDMLGGAGEQLMAFGEQINTIFQQGIISVQGFINWIVQGFMQGIMSIQSFGIYLLQLPNYIIQAVQQGIANFQSLISQTSSVLNSVIGAVASFGGNLIGQLSGAASSAVSSFGSGLSGMVAEAWAEFNDVLSAIADFGAQAISAAQNIGAQITQALFNRHSPGILAQETFLEMRDSKMFLEQGLSDMVDITRVGSNSILNNFNPDLNSNIDNSGNAGTSGLGGGVTMNIVINGDVDSEERMERFADYIINRMNWDNTTAGRTV